ncbi:hypothetical protein LCGC14_1407080 [marine sediment metagenome]|uniref:Uncharacterized protein n=1 Tax=marine sediment metagenome TaxID=412755 RepID=A0A0F9MX17_9ZZZZ
MDTYSQYGPRPEPQKTPSRPPQQQPEEDVARPYTPPPPPVKRPKLWESFMGGFKSRPDLSLDNAYKLWSDLRLTREQWLQKYPGMTAKDYNLWRRKSAPIKPTWLQKLLLPKEVRERMKRGLPRI